MKVAERKTAVGVFHDRNAAQQAIDALKRAGFTESHIGVASQHTGDAPAIDRATNSKVAEGAGIGAAAGAGIGALWGLGVAASVFQPLGIVAGGTLMALLASAGTGAAIATVVGALVGLGIPQEEAEYYEGQIKSG